MPELALRAEVLGACAPTPRRRSGAFSGGTPLRAASPRLGKVAQVARLACTRSPGTTRSPWSVAATATAHCCASTSGTAVGSTSPCPSCVVRTGSIGKRSLAAQAIQIVGAGEVLGKVEGSLALGALRAVADSDQPAACRAADSSGGWAVTLASTLFAAARRRAPSPARLRRRLVCRPTRRPVVRPGRSAWRPGPRGMIRGRAAHRVARLRAGRALSTR